MNPTTETLPLIYDGDSYHLSLSTHEHYVQLHEVVRYDDNQNVRGVALAFRDLPPDAKRAVIQQINRRYSGRMVKT